MASKCFNFHAREYQSAREIEGLKETTFYNFYGAETLSGTIFA
jgi:hypothetical protein